jgi:hypothetical protein
MSGDDALDAGAVDAGAAPRGRPPWVWVLLAACAVVAVGVVVAVAGLFLTPNQPPAQPPPSAGASGAASSADASGYHLSDPLPFTGPPVWHASPSTEYRLTAAARELRYVSDAGCSLSFRVGPLHATTSPSPSGAGSTTPGAPSAGRSPSASPSTDPETAATEGALQDAVSALRASAKAVDLTGGEATVVTTLDSLTGPLVDMAGTSVRVTALDGTVAYGRLAVRALPSAGSAASILAQCPSPEAAATAMNHASVHAFLTAR